MKIEDCVLARRVSGLMVGCKDNRAPMPECSNCGWNKQEDARRRRLPLKKGADGLYSRSETIIERKRKRRYVKVIYTFPESDEELLYDSISKAAEAAGVSLKTMSSWLNRETTKECAKYWRYADGD